jgi:protein-tyrosine sulfotransferase
MSATAILRTRASTVSLRLHWKQRWKGKRMPNVNRKSNRRTNTSSKRAMRLELTNGKSGASSGARPPGFVLCPARSGSTLLRLILNGHPEVACPPETNLGQVFADINFSVSVSSETGRADNESTLSEQATQHASAISREVADRVLGAYARARGKTMWVDKSLPSVLLGDILTKVYPNGRFVCLYRQCPDTVASLHEASTWSYESFGVLPFVQATPANLVQALTAYWADRVALLQGFEQAHPDLTLRLRYEDLVARPEEIIAQVLGFLGVRDDEAVVASALAFQPGASAVWPGDVKVRFSQGIDSSSVGRGWSVPFDMVTQDLRDRVDRLSHELGYRPLPNLKQYTTASATPLISDAAPSGPHSQEARRLLDERVPTPTGTRRVTRSRTSTLLKLVLTDLPGPWMVDFNSGQVESRDGEANWLALTDSETLLSLVSGRSNPGMAMRSSALQVVSASEQTAPDEFLDCVDELMTLLRG